MKNVNSKYATSMVARANEIEEIKITYPLNLLLVVIGNKGVMEMKNKEIAVLIIVISQLKHQALKSNTILLKLCKGLHENLRSYTKNLRIRIHLQMPVN